MTRILEICFPATITIEINFVMFFFLISDVVEHQCCVWPSGQPCPHPHPHSSAFFHNQEAQHNRNLLNVQDEFQRIFNRMKLTAGSSDHFRKSVQMSCLNGVCNYHERSCQNGVCSSQRKNCHDGVCNSSEDRTINDLGPNAGEIDQSLNLNAREPNENNQRANEPASYNTDTDSERRDFNVQAIQVI